MSNGSERINLGDMSGPRWAGGTNAALMTERDAALKALAESRAQFGDSEARRAELEAAIQAVRDLADRAEHGALRWADPLPVPEWVPRVRAVLSEPSVVLEDRDREVAARTLDAMADEGERFMFGATGERMPSDMDAEGIQPRWHEICRLRERAAAIRKGEHA